MRHTLVAVKGAGDLASGVIHRLARAGFAVMASELAQPTNLRRTVAFAEAVVLGEMTVEGVTARRVTSVAEAREALVAGLVPVVVDPDGSLFRQMQPAALVEATLTKYNSGVTMQDAPIVIALGPGYEAGRDVHAVVETNRGHNLGRVYVQGTAEPNTGVPGTIGGYSAERLLRAPCVGKLYSVRAIGDMVQAGETVAVVRPADVDDADAMPVSAAISGILRGLVRDGLPVSTGMKIGDVDSRAKREHCFTISDKARAVAGGVLEAVLHFSNG
ncbi:MAG: EF2563 family selenium-dependent molybdenum hydroxylase system protein [Ktedonobacteraceae bacterium]|nr:EF2563 family selenium-dependent molybdenum hydroxylase system protein [Ktedonobacteraceae bacterium]